MLQSGELIDSSHCAQDIAATAAALLVGFWAALWTTALAASEPLEPVAALADFALPPGYRIELVAAEPEIVDPVAMAFDPQGRLWVVEMRDYPLLAAGAPPSSRIRILEDKNRDGRFESASTFADGLLFPTGLQLWGSGAFVTLAGEIAYFPDDDHDSRADRHETWYRGFATHNEQLRANHPTLAADGLIYVAGGLRGGTIENVRRPADAPISINGRDFAFNPRTGEFRAVSGNGQFGLAIDDYGRRFTCSNRNPLIEVMIEQRYQDLNPALILPAVVQDAAAAGADSRIFARSRALTTSAQHAGQFTAACGVDIYRGDGLPTTAYGNAFICEPTANVVHREIMTPYGSVMRARSAEQDAEFLTAADEWFRPVNLADGPDGALYVVDMYRAVIEHPEWMTPELRDRPDLLKGIDRGRIYRILAEGASGTSADGVFPIEADPEKLAGSLSHPNSWRRETAARLLLELGGAAVVAPLQRAAASADTTSARWLAFSTLDALSGLKPDAISTMLRDGAPEIRALGLRLAEPHLATSAALATEALELAVDPDPRVRYQAALTSMVLPSLQTVAALREIALKGAGDDWTCRAVALASREQAGALLSELLAPDVRVEFTPALARELMAAVVAQDQGQQLPVVLSSFDRVDRQTSRALLLAAQDALQQRGMSLVSVLEALYTSAPTAHCAIQNLFDESLARICDGSIAESARIAEAPLLQLDARPAVGERLLELLAADASTPIQAAAIAALRSQTAPELADALLAHVPSQLPTVRRATVELLSSRREWTAKLLHAVATEQIAASDVDPARRLQLMQSPDPVVRTEAERLFGSEFKDREVVVGRYQPALQLSGDAERGHAVYLGNCASCHRVGNEGTAIGPDIGDASMKTSAQLLTDILDPNRAVDANFVNYVALTVDGVSHQGLIKSETENGLVLLGADGKSVAILREDLQSLASGNSLMPVGLERQIDPQQMADLLAFLKTWRHAAELRANRTDDHANAASLP
ncbi:MAG: c-type cytochrome [Planctomycetaceae bacterium]|nr:c-type cytochrome [Planctomycetaceae bacterium]